MDMTDDECARDETSCRYIHVEDDDDSVTKAMDARGFDISP